VDAGRASDRARASPLSEVVPSYKTYDKSVDGHDIDKGPMREDESVDSHDIDEGPIREVELRGVFLAASFPHPQQ
jgi:hypothetical protein